MPPAALGQRPLPRDGVCGELAPEAVATLGCLEVLRSLPCPVPTSSLASHGCPWLAGAEMGPPALRKEGAAPGEGLSWEALRLG